ncbi:methionine--tRNA ligase [Sulfuriroseicoccus oceanibius]|uniref:Methionine--tRNA ligase n=1 Tax=Sulfuriroseicoccus oceanibius TaxID=2707525 RepID=A0A6B3L2W3_9BACT|nr:methionine--tRNA ligase [Sulfuriroseicoccus oceanibius]QQL44549.1 methionine--tRNA ligase [Sulfuriroseicoccus oceanibius]
MRLITTAIDYTNGSPHIGHAYEKVLADVLTRYDRFAGRDVYFLTGVDQHGQKVQQSAEKENVHPATYANRITKGFLKLWETLDVKYDGWAATTDPRHATCVQAILQKLHDDGQLYKKSHQGFYSVRQEQFLTDRDRNEQGEFGPEWGEVQEVEEENWYFKLSDHVEWLRGFVESHPDFVFPEFRRQELLNALEKSEKGGDLCISRPKSRLRWGIELPFDPEFVTYVWFDALTNYISFAGYEAADNAELPKFESLWSSETVHIIGKDILVPPHGIYWPIMLHAIGFSDEQMPKLLVHGWWNIRGEKMSKSLGNVVDPAELAETFGPDGLRYYLVRDIATGADADFSPERIITRFNSDLANDFGNLCNRTLNMVKRYRGGELTADSGYDDEICQALRSTGDSARAGYAEAMDNNLPHLALEHVWKWIVQTNQFAEQSAPWALAKDEDKAAQLDAVLYHMAEVIAEVSLLIAPVMPAAAANLQDQLRLTPEQRSIKLGDLGWGLLPSGHTTGKPKPLFPRLQLEKED